MAKKFGKSMDEVLAETDAEEVVRGEKAAIAESAPSVSAPIAEASELERQAGVVPLTIHVTPEDRRRIRHLVAETGISAQQLGLAAWSLLLASRGLPPMAPTKANVPDGRRKKTTGGGRG